MGARARVLLVAVVMALASLAGADDVHMVDGTVFRGVRVESYSPAEGFMARIPEGGRLSTDLYDIPTWRLVRIEFRAEGDTAPAPAGRPALMAMTDGSRHPGSIVETATVTAGSLTLRVRQAHTAPGSAAFDLPASRIASLDFTAPVPPPPTPPTAPVPGMPGAAFPGQPGFPPPAQPGGPAPGPDTYSEWDQSDEDDDDWESDWSSGGGGGTPDIMQLMQSSGDPEAMAAMLGITIGVVAAIIGIVLGLMILFNSILLYALAKGFKIEFTFPKALLAGTLISIGTIVVDVVFSLVSLPGIIGGPLRLFAVLAIIRTVCVWLMDIEGGAGWSMAFAMWLVTVLLKCGLIALVVIIAMTVFLAG